MEKKQIDLKVLMARLCKVVGVPYTSDFHKFIKRLHEADFLTNDEMNRIEQYFEHR